MTAEPATHADLLHRASAGDADAAAQFFPLVYAELHALAQRFLRDERSGHTLQATALVHEAYLRMVGDPGVPADDRAQFLRVAGGAMRRVLVDAARRHRREKRGAGRLRLELAEDIAQSTAPSVDLLELDEALERLARQDAGLVRLVELRFFAGLSHAEVAGVLGIGLRSVERGWALARAWLNRELSGGG